MRRTENELRGISLLGNQNTQYHDDYNPEVLETFINKHPDNDYVVSFDAYEFTSKCLAGDTLVDVACNESEHPRGIPIKDLVGTEGYVFGFDCETQLPVCRKYFDVRQTGKDVPVVRIEMETHHGNGSTGVTYGSQSLVCTPDHLLLVKEGFRGLRWVQAKDLKPGMRLISDQRKGDCLRDHSRHRLIAEAAFDGIPENYHVHHIDGNHKNNSPENLTCLAPSEHFSTHRSQEYAYKNIPSPEELAALYDAGENVHSLSKKFGVDTSTIYARLNGLVQYRSQSESLRLKNQLKNAERDQEICALYAKGYLVKEIASYMGLHDATISVVLKRNNIEVKEANAARIQRGKLELPPLNHKVISVEPYEVSDVYNMEVEDVHNFFANDVVVHNCPKTGQPDFAKIVISYIPREKMVESKSLKLYLFSFRNHGDFHEDCINIITKDLVKLMNPKYLEVRGIFSPRGGISIYPFVNYVAPDCGYLDDLARQRRLDVLRDASNRTIRYDI